MKLKLGFLSALLGLTVLAQIPARASSSNVDLAASVQVQVKANGMHHLTFGVRNDDVFPFFVGGRQVTLGVQYFQLVMYGNAGAYQLVFDSPLLQYTESALLFPGWSDTSWLEYKPTAATHYVRYYLRLESDANPYNDYRVTPITHYP